MRRSRHEEGRFQPRFSRVDAASQPLIRFRTKSVEPVAGGIWLPTSIRFAGEGRAILFRKLNVDFAIDWYDYRLINN